MVALRLQFFTFLNMIIVGIAIGVSFDFYRVIIRKFNLARILVDIFDIIFSILVTISISLVLFYSNGGVFRGYIFIGLCSGGIIYYQLLSSSIIKVFTKLLNLLFYIISKIKRIVIILFNRIKLIISKIRN